MFEIAMPWFIVACLVSEGFEENVFLSINVFGGKLLENRLQRTLSSLSRVLSLGRYCISDATIAAVVIK